MTTPIRHDVHPLPHPAPPSPAAPSAPPHSGSSAEEQLEEIEVEDLEPEPVQPPPFQPGSMHDPRFQSMLQELALFVRGSDSIAGVTITNDGTGHIVPAVVPFSFTG